MTQGKTSLTVTIQSTGALYGLGSPSNGTGENDQFDMDRAGRAVYRACTHGQPDVAWSDAQDRIVAINRGADRLWVEPFWQAKAGTGVNGIGRFYYSTPTHEQYGVLETTPQFTSGGAYFVRPNNADMPEQTRFAPPDALTGTSPRARHTERRRRSDAFTCPVGDIGRLACCHPSQFLTLAKV